jgi:hypothetical protein
MKPAHTLTATAVLASLFLAGAAMAQTDKDTVRWDDRAGQWVYTLYNPANQSLYQELRYTPRSLIEPRVKSSVRRDKDRYEYSYRISNGATARQAIGYASVLAPKWNAEAIKHAPLAPGLNGTQLMAIARAEVAAEKAFVANTVDSPKRWEPFLNLNSPERVVFGWLVDSKKEYSGVAPRSAQGGFGVVRPELPGASWIFFKGATPDSYIAASLPRSGALAEQAEQVFRQDSVTVAALVPAIIVPTPYNAAELARRIKAHVATWPDSGMMNADVFQAVGSKLDGLISALGSNDKKASASAAKAVIAEVRKYQVDINEAGIDDDDDAHDSKSDKRKLISARGTLEDVIEPSVPVQRVAVRALVFDLRYLLERL